MDTGRMYYWRWKEGVSSDRTWKFGWVYKFIGGGLVSIGRYNGDTHGVVVTESEIEYKPYQ